ncbi:MAG: putative nitrogen fixation protein NifT [Colwellia sp.]
MPKVMIKKEDAGFLSFYIAKRDVEIKVASIEFDQENNWGGTFELTDGSRFYIDPISPAPKLPITLMARRA